MTAATSHARAAVLTAPGRAQVTTVPLSRLRDDHARVTVEGCGVCGSNLPLWEGRPWFRYPLDPGVPGHEAWGHVTDVGDAAGDAVRPGDRVAFLSDTAFADTVDVPYGDLVRLPGRLTGPFPGEALGCAFNVARRSGFTEGQAVCIVGAGFLGTVVGALAAQAGAHVVAVSRRPFALDVARTMGAKDTFVSDDAATVVEAVREITSGRMCDVVVEAVGAQAPLDLAAELTAERGRLVVAGFHQDGPRSVDMQSWNWRGIDVINAHERDNAVRLDGIRAAAAAVADGRLDATPLYTHTFPLDHIGDAFDAMRHRPDGFLKALVTT